MSIEKVDAYKNEKANRKQTLAKEKSKKKRDKIIGTTLAVAFVAIIAGAIILTFVNEFKSYQESRPNYNRTRDGSAGLHRNYLREQCSRIINHSGCGMPANYSAARSAAGSSRVFLSDGDAA